MRTKFERVVLLTAFGSLVVPSVACIAAETWASQMLNYFGFVYQTIALGMAAYEVNNLDVQTFQGPGFLRRMGWRPHPPVQARSAGPTIDLVAGGTGSLEWPPTEDVLERLRRLEVHVAALKKVDQELERAVKAEVEARKQGDDALKSELQTTVGTIDAKLKEATLGELEYVYVALILGFLGTVLTTFSEGLGNWFRQ